LKLTIIKVFPEKLAIERQKGVSICIITSPSNMKNVTINFINELGAGWKHLRKATSFIRGAKASGGRRKLNFCWYSCWCGWITYWR
jgi:hypothetical protein